MSGELQAPTLSDAEIAAKLKMALDENLVLNRDQLDQLTLSGPFVQLARTRLSGEAPDSPTTIGLKKECVQLISGRIAPRAGSACCAVRRIDLALTIDAVSQSSA